MVDEIEEEELTAPPPKKKKPKVSNLETSDSSQTKVSDLETLIETMSSPEFNEDNLAQAASLGSKKLRKKLAIYTEEYHFLASDSSSAGLARKVTLARILRTLQDLLDAREAILEVTVPQSPTGHHYVVGPIVFNPGTYKVRAGVASYLLWMIGESQRVELQRLQQNGRTVDLGTIGDRVKQIHAAITRE